MTTTATRPADNRRRPFTGNRSTGNRPFNWRRAIAWVLLGVAIAVSILPFYWVLRTALSTNGSLAANSTSLLPADFNLGAFKRVFGLQTAEEAIAEGGSGASINFWQYLWNSLLFSSITTAGAVFFSSMAAYAFARLRWKGRDGVFSLFLGTMLVPPIFTALPNFLLVKNLGLLNSMLGMVLPYLFMTPFAIFFMRQFFLNMSREVEEAAMLDGAKHWRIFFQIVMPNAAAPIATLALLTFMGQWNEYFWPLLVGTTEETRVLTVGLGVFKSQAPQGAPDWSGLMAATLVSATPVLILFAIFGKKIVNSIGFNGTK
ncbi:carbohydrate ABC transporter permease [Arthrobacter cupressi]|uniref:Multiple sugar transport system permease protein n=1 Tax=Arthrobacter cupressi TaxID=1045773 RepID=A0A1G8KEB0_9MICC|nr:carbohydrate ABC transporter permease [Arthrobacter cupressi]NYD77262.1 multiple sugar transport system permease protein [Arthrobacter cupressi]SDI41190.1 multiple sugar transport system permease protein [Arthrobacter cupressi]